MAKKIIIANWKMNPDSLKEAKALYSETKKIAGDLKKVRTIVCPPSTYLYPLTSSEKTKKANFQLGAQSSFYSNKGSHTGGVSSAMCKDAGAKFVLVGHSERRAEGESSLQASMSINTIFDAGLTPVLCVGEKDRDEHGFFLKYLEEQLTESISGVSKKRVGELIVAYEPLWAIGREGVRPATPEESLEIALYIRKLLSSKIGAKQAKETPILYGGSVDDKNCEEFLVSGGVEGLLVGRASLSSAQFGKILKVADSVA